MPSPVKHPNFVGFPVPVSPFTETWLDQVLDPQDSGHVLQEFKITITIAYDNATRVLASTGTAHRDPGCKWKRFVTFIGQPGEHSVQIPVGNSTFNTADLGVTTIEGLNNASFTVDR